MFGILKGMENNRQMMKIISKRRSYSRRLAGMQEFFEMMMRL
jgi:hypothetical protein